MRDAVVFRSPQAAIIYAEGEAEAATLISQAVKSAGSGMIEVKRIDVSHLPCFLLHPLCRFPFFVLWT
jgi:hypothetical protein